MARLTAKVERSFKIPGDSDGASIKLLHLKPGDIQRIEAETSRWLGKTVDGQFASELEYHPSTQMRKLRTAALVGWNGFFNADDEPLEYSAKNKELLLDEDMILGDGDDAKPLSAWIDKFRAELADSMKPQEDAAEKN